jgi:hypothetical protein
MKPEDIIDKLQSGGFKLDPSFIKLLSMVADEAMRYEREACAKQVEDIGDDLAIKHESFDTWWSQHIADELRAKDNG